MNTELVMARFPVSSFRTSFLSTETSLIPQSSWPPLQVKGNMVMVISEQQWKEGWSRMEKKEKSD